MLLLLALQMQSSSRPPPKKTRSKTRSIFVQCGFDLGSILPPQRTSKTIIEDEAEIRGDVIVFTPKFHAELAPIESAYREVAKVLREQNVVGTSRDGFFYAVYITSESDDLRHFFLRVGDAQKISCKDKQIHKLIELIHRVH